MLIIIIIGSACVLLSVNVYAYLRCRAALKNMDEAWESTISGVINHYDTVISQIIDKQSAVNKVYKGVIQKLCAHVNLTEADGTDNLNAFMDTQEPQ